VSPESNLTEPQAAARRVAEEGDRVTYGQRRVNLIWELTQALVALSVTATTLYVSANLSLKDQSDAAAALLLSNAFFLVIGFYFGRTNHQRTGGVPSGEIGR
jgi:NAD(P)-dependent dehydrogenase (short-subunit alcohol dehydrogenase family)